MRRFVTSFAMVLCLLLFVSACASGDEENANTDQAKPSELSIGSPAPELDVEHWVQDGNGKFSKVTKFEPDKVYVVEFWATWCGPCIASMPHLAETQQKYADQVQLISISDEPLETVQAFLKRNVRGDEAKTYQELTSVYCLTTDPDRSSHDAYMRAAKQNGIPTAFIVGKDGHVEWIGHPMRMDEPLEQVVNDEWDREKFKQQFQEQQRQQENLLAIRRAMATGDVDEALKLVDQLLAGASPAMARTLNNMKLQLLLQSDNAEAADVARSLAAELEDGSAHNELAWMIYQAAAGGKKVSDDLVAVAVDSAEKAVATTEGQLKGYSLDTLAHLKHHQGNLDEAIKLQTQAVELAPEEQLTQFLKQLQDEQANADGNDSN